MDLKTVRFIYAAYKRLTSYPKTQMVKVIGWKKIFHKNGNKKRKLG